ncbi:MAG: type II secretion system F family protein [Gemmatimonadaceae bacterium]|nr:type II secretion system F family protein [Gemmatimonadaceae bacterium]
MSTVVLFLVFFGTLLLVLTAYGYMNRGRLEALAALRSRGTPGSATANLEILRDVRASAVPLLDRLLHRIRITPLITHALARAGVHWSAGEFVIGSVLLASLGLLATPRFGLFVSVPLACVGVALPTMVVAFRTRKRLAHFAIQLPDAIDMVVNAMRAGFSFQAAMKFVGDEMPKPVGEEFMAFYDAQRLGIDVRSALLDLQERVGTLDAKMFVTSLLIQRETGGNLTEILGGLATLIRDRGALMDQIDTLTAEPKFTGAILAALPIVAFAAMMLLNPTMMQPMFVSRTGQLMLGYAALSIVLGYLMVRRIARIAF